MNRITSSTLLLLSLLILATDIHAFVPFSSSRTASHSKFNTRLGVFGDDSFDMDELRQRISQEAVPPLFAVTTPRRPEFVHAVFFNPHTDREGMHTIEYPQGSGNNVILAFEDANDCAAFSQDLQRQHFYNPTVSYIWLYYLIHCVFQHVAHLFIIIATENEIDDIGAFVCVTGSLLSSRTKGNSD